MAQRNHMNARRANLSQQRIYASSGTDTVERNPVLGQRLPSAQSRAGVGKMRTAASVWLSESRRRRDTKACCCQRLDSYPDVGRR